MSTDPADRVSDVAAFVMKHGAMAEELLFGDTELPGLTDAERRAIERVEEHLEATWLGILRGCREETWALAGGRSKLGKTLRKSKRRDSTIWKRDSVEMPLVADSSWLASCGVTLAVWAPESKYVLRPWVWTQARFRDLARDATRAVSGLEVRRNGALQWVDLGTPKEGDRFEDLSKRAAEVLWTLAEPVGRAVLGARAVR